MLEVELKAKVKNSNALIKVLEALKQAASESEIYRDTYFDLNGALHREDKELRVRSVSGKNARNYLTFKDSPFDSETRSKPEYEVAVDSSEKAIQLVMALGYKIDIQISKHCENYEFVFRQRKVLASVVCIPELDSHFIELESLVNSMEDVVETKGILLNVLQHLGISASELTTESYTDKVREARALTVKE